MREAVKFIDPIQVGVLSQEGKIVVMSNSIGAVPEDIMLSIGKESYWSTAAGQRFLQIPVIL